jgi:hypothetical protein
MPTLYEQVTGWMKYQARKHELGNDEDYANAQVDAMSNSQLLYAISEALEELKNKS